MKKAATILAALASMGLASACASANGQTSGVAPATGVASAAEPEGDMDVRVRRFRSMRGNAGEIIDTYDQDDDGRISREEYYDRPNRDRFSKLDADEDGFVDEAELEKDMAKRMERRAARHAKRMERHVERMERQAERALRHAERQKDKLLERLDRNENGEIDSDDFDFDFEFDGEAFEERMQAHRQRVVKRLDTDGDGSISRDEFSARTDRRFDKLDKDGDGKLGADELDGAAMLHGFMGPMIEGLAHVKPFGKRHRAPGRDDFGFDDDDYGGDYDDEDDEDEAEKESGE